jgi:perosamine synthetase
LFTALRACGVVPGDEVLVPDLTMIATATATILAGGTPVFVDIDPVTLCMDLDLAERAITPRTRALLLVSLNGRSPDMSSVVDLCNGRGITLVEDAAQSLGSTWQRRHLGTFGAAGVLSFSAPKIITTGQGGAVLTADPEIAKRAVSLKDFGRVAAGTDVHDHIGFNFKFTDVQAVIGLEQMKKLEWRVERKKAMYRLYVALLQDVPQVRFVPTNLDATAPWFIDVYVDDAAGLRAALTARQIGSRPVYPALHSQPAINRPGSFPVAERVARSGLWLPSSARLTDEEIGRVCEAIISHYR